MNSLRADHDEAASSAPPAPTVGLMPRLVTRWLFRQAQVDRNEALAPGLHLIELSGPGLRGARWTAGDKLQIQVGAGLQTRTYTPWSWDAAAGRTAFLAHALAAGPGSEWVRRARPDQTVAVFGPRRSLDLAAALVERQADEHQLQALTEAARAAGTDRHFVLVGRARTVQFLSRALRQHGVAASRIRTKAYWADGKVGLDGEHLPSASHTT